MSARKSKAKGKDRWDAEARIFAALGDPTRLKLVAVLCAGGAFSIAQLTSNTEISG